MKIRSYAELAEIHGLRERYDYLRLNSRVGVAVFGHERYLNQKFYTSAEWRHVRDIVIARDEGCDMGLPDWPIFGDPAVHHMNPMTIDDIRHGEEWIVNPEYLITVSHPTHNAIHFGDQRLLPTAMIARRPGDTRLW